MTQPATQIERIRARIAELRKVHDASTPGEWEAVGGWLTDNMCTALCRCEGEEQGIFNAAAIAQYHNTQTAMLDGYSAMVDACEKRVLDEGTLERIERMKGSMGQRWYLSETQVHDAALVDLAIIAEAVGVTTMEETK